MKLEMLAVILGIIAPAVSVIGALTGLSAIRRERERVLAHLGSVRHLSRLLEQLSRQLRADISDREVFSFREVADVSPAALILTSWIRLETGLEQYRRKRAEAVPEFIMDTLFVLKQLRDEVAHTKGETIDRETAVQVATLASALARRLEQPEVA